MNGKRTLSEWFRYVFLPLNKTQRDITIGVLPFYFLVVVVVIWVWVVYLQDSPVLVAPARRVIFILLMIVHLALHLTSAYTAYKRPLVLPYLAIQLALTISLVLISGGEVLVYALIFPMVGETLAFYRRQLVIASLLTALLLAAGASLLFYLLGKEALTVALVGIPMAAFVVTFVALFVREADAREEAQELVKELQTAHRQLIEYANQVETLTLAAERERMARELHDTLSQGLTGLVLQLEAAQSHLETGKESRAEQIIQAAMDQARETLADSRRAIAGLRTTPTESQGLEAAIRKEAAQFAKSTGIPCAVDGDLDFGLPAATATQVHRVVAEALSNVTRHAHASQVRITMCQAEGMLSVEISDDGVGFDLQENVLDADHYGILGMRERARLVSGTFEIDTAPGRGTRVKITAPIDEVV